MRILDRYVVRQLFPVWLWCLTVFLFLSCLIDLFEHLDEILRYHINSRVLINYYANFIPIVFVRASPLALLFGAAFIASRLSRHQELLAMKASGTSLLRASLPFLFVGWLASSASFLVGDFLLPQASLRYEQLRQEAFRGRKTDERIENVALLDAFNRLYHARELDVKQGELHDLTVLEHDWDNRPVKSLYASRAVWTKHGWLLLHGTIYRIDSKGRILGDPQPYVERLIAYPVSLESFREPDARPETMRYAQLRFLMARLQQAGITNIRRYEVELVSKLTLPLMNLVICLIAFVGSTQPQLRGHVRGLGTSLAWGLAYYLLVATSQGVAKEFAWLPIMLAVWLPHLAVGGWSVWKLQTTR